MTLAALGSCHVTSSRQGVIENFQFSRFLEHISEFSKFFREIYMLARSYRALAENINNLLISALVSVEARIKVPIFAIFVFFKLSVLAQVFDLGQ